MITVNALGDQCPIPVIKTKNMIATMKEGGEVETLVDNEIAVQNLTKMAEQKGYAVTSKKIRKGQYSVVMTVPAPVPGTEAEPEEEPIVCDIGKSNTVVVISADTMGRGDDVLGAVLIKGYIYALSQQDIPPRTVLFYNGGAKLTCKGSESIEDIKLLASKGVEILTCGTCLNHYGIKDDLMVGEVTNMYVIAEKMSQAGKVIKPC